MLKLVVISFMVMVLDGGSLSKSERSTHAALGGLSRITSMTADDTGDGTDTSSIDLSQIACDDNSAEPFFDTVLKVSVQNTSSTTFFIRRVSFTVRNPYGAGGVFRSRRFSLVGSGEVPPETENKELKALFLDVNGSGKSYAGETAVIPANLGFRNVRVQLHGRDGRGRAVTLSGRTVLSFDAVDRCA